MDSLVLRALVLMIAFRGSQCTPTPKINIATDLVYITLEEHFDVPASYAPQEANSIFQIQASSLGDTYSKYISDIEQYRLPSMNKNKISMQIISSDPMPDALEDPVLVKDVNNQLAEAISRYPDRLRGFCFLPMALPEAAAEELQRCVDDLGLLGALVDNHLDNMTFYDTAAYDSFWATAQRLNVPIYLHPTYPPAKDVTEPGGRETPNHDDYSELAAAILSAQGYGWHVDTGLSFLRLWLGGVFDRFPNVKIVVGHMGETVPYMLDRASDVLDGFKTDGVLVKEAWAKNVWVTTSGFFSLSPFATLQKTTAIDRILFSVDYPWATNENGVAFMEDLKASGLVSDSDWEKIAFRNAQSLLRL